MGLQRLGRILFLSTIALLGDLHTACAPTIHPVGPAVTEPRIETARPADAAIVAADGVRLPLQTWRPESKPRAVILALHGFNDYANAVALPAAYWAARGVMTYAYDQRGFGRAPHRGEWAGTAAMTGDLRNAARLLKVRHPEVPLFLLGVSMGGAVAMAAMAEGPVQGVAGAVLVGPAVWGRAYMNPFQRGALWLLSSTMPFLTLTGEGLNRQPSDNIQMLRALGRDPLIIRHTRVDAIKGLVDLMDAAAAAGPRLDHTKLLMIYGMKDEIVPKQPVLDVMRGLPARAGTVRALYDGSWHMMLRDLKAEIVWRDIAGWMEDAAAPLPSGADRRAAAILAADKDRD